MKASDDRLEALGVRRRAQRTDPAAPRVNALLAALNAASAELDPDGRITRWSAGARRLLGWSGRQVVGRFFFDLLAEPDEPSAASALLVPANARRGPRAATLNLRRADGTVVPAELHVIPRAGRRPRFDAVIATTVPFARAAETFRGVFERASFGILVLSVDGIVLDGNAAAATLLGCTREALVGSAFEALSSASTTRGPLQDAIAHTLAGGAERMTCRVRTGAGRLLTVEFTFTPGSYFGQPAVLLFAQDVTRLRLARAELGQVREQLRALLDASPLPALSVDAGRRLTAWNAAAEQVFGWTAEEVLKGEPPLLLGGEEEGNGWLDQALRGDRLHGVPAVARRSDGGPLRISVSAAPLLDGAGAAAGCVALLMPASEPLPLEELERAQNLNALGALASRVAHDFNNILTVVEGDAELLALEMREHGTELPEELLGIQDAAARAGELTRQLLAFGRGDKGEPGVLDLNQSVADLSRMLRRLVGADVELVVRPEAEVPWILGVRGELDRVLVNLVVNARDAMESGGRLTVQTLNLSGRAAPRVHGDPERWVALRVGDTGCGIHSDVLNRIFDPFFTTKPAGKGTGLGLWTVERVVRAAGGHVRVHSAPGQGTEVTALFPIAVPMEGRVTIPRLDPELLAEAEESAGCTVLVAEDDPDLGRVMRLALERAGFEVALAENGEEALREWSRRGGAVGLVVADLLMPLMGGRELVAAIRADKPEVPVLLVSGYTDPGALVEGEGISVLRKPFGAGEFVRAVNGAVARAGGAFPEERVDEGEPAGAPAGGG